MTSEELNKLTCAIRSSKCCDTHTGVCLIDVDIQDVPGDVDMKAMVLTFNNGKIETKLLPKKDADDNTFIREFYIEDGILVAKYNNDETIQVFDLSKFATRDELKTIHNNVKHLYGYAFEDVDYIVECGDEVFKCSPITPKPFRDGDSLYYINELGEKIRLMDVPTKTVIEEKEVIKEVVKEVIKEVEKPAVIPAFPLTQAKPIDKGRITVSSSTAGNINAEGAAVFIPNQCYINSDEPHTFTVEINIDSTKELIDHYSNLPEGVTIEINTDKTMARLTFNCDLIKQIGTFIINLFDKFKRAIFLIIGEPKKKDEPKNTDEGNNTGSEGSGGSSGENNGGSSGDENTENPEEVLHNVILQVKVIGDIKNDYAQVYLSDMQGNNLGVGHQFKTGEQFKVNTFFDTGKYRFNKYNIQIGDTDTDDTVFEENKVFTANDNTNIIVVFNKIEKPKYTVSLTTSKDGERESEGYFTMEEGNELYLSDSSGENYGLVHEYEKGDTATVVSFLNEDLFDFIKFDIYTKDSIEKDYEYSTIKEVVISDKTSINFDYKYKYEKKPNSFTPVNVRFIVNATGRNADEFNSTVEGKIYKENKIKDVLLNPGETINYDLLRDINIDNEVYRFNYYTIDDSGFIKSNVMSITNEGQFHDKESITVIIFYGIEVKETELITSPLLNTAEEGRRKLHEIGIYPIHAKSLMFNYADNNYHKPNRKINFYDYNTPSFIIRDNHVFDSIKTLKIEEVDGDKTYKWDLNNAYDYGEINPFSKGDLKHMSETFCYINITEGSLLSSLPYGIPKNNDKEYNSTWVASPTMKAKSVGPYYISVDQDTFSLMQESKPFNEDSLTYSNYYSMFTEGIKIDKNSRVLRYVIEFKDKLKQMLVAYVTLNEDEYVGEIFRFDFYRSFTYKFNNEDTDFRFYKVTNIIPDKDKSNVSMSRLINNDEILR